MLAALDSWVQQLLGIEDAVAGEGTAWRIVATYPWAPWAAVLFFLFTVGFVAWVYRREGAARWFAKVGLGTLRIAAIFLVAFALLPGWKLQIDRTGLPFVAVIIDDSRSMRTADLYDDEKLRQLIADKLKDAQVKPADGQASRLDLAKAILLAENGALLKGLEEKFRLKVYYLSQTARVETGGIPAALKSVKGLEATGTQTRLGEGVRQVLADLSGNQLAAIVLLTDGINTAGEPLTAVAAQAARKQIKLLTVGLGSEQVVRDLELNDLVVDDVVFVDDIVNFNAMLTGTGFAGNEVEVRLLREGQERPLATEKVRVGADGVPTPVRIAYRPPTEGEFDFIVEVAPQEKESNPRNNRERKHVSVRKERIRVLLVQAYPNFEYRYLKTMLERDKTIDLKVVLQEADQEFADFDRAALAIFPVSKEQLHDQFDVIIFGDVDPSLLSPGVQDNIATFVTEKGGGIAFIAGPKFTPMAYANSPLVQLFPVDLRTARAPSLAQPIKESFHPALTDLGRASPHLQLGDDARQTEEIWKKLPGLYWLLEAGDVKPAARVLAEHPTKTGGQSGRKLPVILYQPVGAGAVLFHATDDSWRWRYQIGDIYFGHYWKQAIRYLSRSKLYGKSKQAELASDREKYQPGQPIRLRVRFLDVKAAPDTEDGVQVMVERGDTKQPITLRRTPTSRADFEAVMTDPPDGRYHAWLLSPALKAPAGSVADGSAWSPAADFEVLPPVGESERTPMDAVELKRAAEDTKGRYFTFATAGSLADSVPAGRPVPVESLPPYPIWNRWPLLALALLLLTLEWVLRKSQGML